MSYKYKLGYLSVIRPILSFHVMFFFIGRLEI